LPATWARWCNPTSSGCWYSSIGTPVHPGGDAAVTTAKNADSGLDPGAAYAAVLFYLLSYSLVSVGAFTIVSDLGGQGERYINTDDFAGLGTRQPFAAAALSCSCSLLGLPITAGFFGKLYIFTAAIKSSSSGWPS